MAAQVLPGSLAAVEEGAGGVLRYVARQPILDVVNRVHGYELLFRAGPETNFGGDGDMATRIMLDNTVMFGMDRLASGALAFVNCTREALTGDLVQILSPATTVLEILEDIEPTPALVEACIKLKEAGFRLALDDFTWKPSLAPLVELADYVKVDFVLTSSEERRKLLRLLSKFPLQLIAEKIETQAEFAEARQEGFTLFQGYYFCRPMLLENRKVPANRLSQVEILRHLRAETLELRTLARLVKRDASLTYRLLRLANSPLCAQRHEVSSIESALLAVGDDHFRRLATLAITCELGKDQPVEILRMAFVRGRFCELAARMSRLDDTEQYLLGMLSLLPAMLRVPMADLTPALPLRAEIRRALESATGPERCLLCWLEHYERGDWTGCDELADTHRLDRGRLLEYYADAVVWAEEAVRFVA